MSLTVEGLTYAVEDTSILSGVDLEVGEGDFVGLVGPNGSGKSTTIQCIAEILTPDDGRIRFRGRPMEEYSPAEQAREIGVVGQDESVDFEFTVREIIRMGRSPHKRLFEGETDEDRTVVDRALKQVGMATFASRSFRTLSGGEQQRGLIARCLAQQASLMILDEPTNHLDVRYQLDILDLLYELEPSVLITIHDLNAAAQYCDRIVVLKDGETVTSGPPEAVLTADRIERVFGREATVDVQPSTGRPRITFAPHVDVG